MQNWSPSTWTLHFLAEGVNGRASPDIASGCEEARRRGGFREELVVGASFRAALLGLPTTRVESVETRKRFSVRNPENQGGA